MWDEATPVFQTQEEKTRFITIQAEHATVLGDYRRIIAVTEAKVIGGTLATFDILTEYSRSQGVRAIFGFYRGSKTRPWKLRSLKVVLPMPRADEAVPGVAGDAGSGSAGSAARPSPGSAVRPR